MANLRCDICGGRTDSYGSWDTPIKILCVNCSDNNNTQTIEPIQDGDNVNDSTITELTENEYWGVGKYIGEEFVEEYGADIEIGNDHENGNYKIKFKDGSEFNNIFEEEIEF